MRIKLFEEYNSGNLDHDFEVVNDLISDLETDLDFEYDISYYDWDEDAYLRKKRSGEKEMIKVFLQFKKDFKVDDFTKVLFNYKPMVDFINKNITVTNFDQLRENNLKIDEMRAKLISDLRKSKFIQRLEEVSNYELVDASYVEMDGVDSDGLNFVREDIWGSRLILKHRG